MLKRRKKGKKRASLPARMKRRRRRRRRFEKGALLHSIELWAGTGRDKRAREQEGWRRRRRRRLFSRLSSSSSSPFGAGQSHRRRNPFTSSHIHKDGFKFSFFFFIFGSSIVPCPFFQTLLYIPNWYRILRLDCVGDHHHGQGQVATIEINWRRDENVCKEWKGKGEIKLMTMDFFSFSFSFLGEGSLCCWYYVQ